MNQEIQSLYNWKKNGRKWKEWQGWSWEWGGSGLSGRCQVDVNTKS